MANYTREQIVLNDILLDVENPRFASYFERTGRTNPTQSDVMDYLLNHESIGGLATRIQAVGELHPAEAIVCCKQDDKYIVLEGNRRICACKTLQEIFSKSSKSWLPEEILHEFPTLRQTQQSDIELVRNTAVINAVVYESRDFAQPYISDKHIDGVKKWESIEKSSYFYRIYQNYKKDHPTASATRIINDIAKSTVSNKAEVKNCIIKYGFFMSVYNVLRETYRPEALTETNSYLPLVDRFMGTLVGNSDVGLNLTLTTDLKYIAHPGKEAIYKKILQLVGEAFLVRKTKNDPDDDGLSRINSKEIDTSAQQKKLIKDNKRIPGLFALISKYRETQESEREGNPTGTKSRNEDGASQGSSGASHTPNDYTQTSSNDNGQDNADVYEPAIPWKPSRPQNKSLSFSSSEGSTFKLSDSDDEDAKIKFVIRELSSLYVYAYPYSCTLLYRTLLEAVTRKAYAEKKPKENKILIPYQGNSLPTMMSKLAKHNVLKLSEAERASIVEYINNKKIAAVLNDYIHHPKLVNTEIILSSWVTMKEYIKACLL